MKPQWIKDYDQLFAWLDDLILQLTEEEEMFTNDKHCQLRSDKWFHLRDKISKRLILAEMRRDGEINPSWAALINKVAMEFQRDHERCDSISLPRVVSVHRAAKGSGGDLPPPPFPTTHIPQTAEARHGEIKTTGS